MNVTTEDLYLAAYLVSEKMMVTGHTRDDHRSIFQISGTGIENLVQQYYSDAVKVSPSAFGRAIRSLKSLMYSNTTLKPHNDNDTNTGIAIQ